MPSRWIEEPHHNFGEGIYRVSNHDDPSFPEGALWDAQNLVYRQESDNPEAMPGGTYLGTTAMGGAVSGMFDYNNGDKLVAAATNGTIYEYGTDWAAATGARATGNSSAAGTRWSGTMFYGATTVANLLILTNGVDAPVRYDTTNGAVALGGSPPATGDFAVAHRGRVWMASGSTLFYSATNDAEDWSTGAGGGNVLIYRGYDGNITGLASWGESLFIFKRSSIYRIPPTATISELNVLRVSDKVGCISHRTIQEVITGSSTALTFFSEHGIEALQPANVSTNFVPLNITRWIKPLVDRRNLQGMSAAWNLWNTNTKELYSFYPTATATVPKEGVIANFARPRKPPRWTRTNIQNLTAGVVFNLSNTDYIQYVGDNSGRVIRMNVTTASDWAGMPYAGVAMTKTYTQGVPHYQKQYGWFYVDVGTSGNYTTRVRTVLMRRGLPPATGTPYDLTVTGTDSGWGVGVWGEALWGGSGNAGERIRPQTAARGRGVRLIIDSDNWFKLNGIVIASVRGASNIAA